MTRKPPRTPSTPPASTPEPATEPGEEPDRLITRAQRAVGTGLAAMERAIGDATKALTDTLDTGKYNTTTAKAASHVAWLTKLGAQVMGELRKSEEHDQKQLGKLRPPLVVEWYRQLTDDERADFLRRVDRIDRARRT